MLRSVIHLENRKREKTAWVQLAIPHSVIHLENRKREKTAWAQLAILRSVIHLENFTACGGECLQSGCGRGDSALFSLDDVKLRGFAEKNV